MVASTCNPSTWVEARSQVQEQPELHGEALSQKYKTLRLQLLLPSRLPPHTDFSLHFLPSVSQEWWRRGGNGREGRTLGQQAHGHLRSFVQR